MTYYRIFCLLCFSRFFVSILLLNSLAYILFLCIFNPSFCWFEQFLKLLLLGHPKQVFIKFLKLLEDCPLSFILRVVLSHLNESIDNFHNEFRVITFLSLEFQNFMFFPIVSLCFQISITTNFYSICIYKIVLSIIHSADIIDCSPHAGSSSICCCLRIAIGQVD